MTELEQKHIDAINAAETDSEKIEAFKAAIDMIAPDHLPLIMLLMQEKDGRCDAAYEREYFKKSDSSRIS